MKKMALIILVVMCVLLVGCCANRYTYSNGDAYTAGGTAVSGKVEELEINWVAGEVKVAYYNGKDISIDEDSERKLSKNDELRWRLDGKTLIIQFAKAGMRLSNNLSKNLTVLLPESLRLEDVKINVVSAMVDAAGVKAEDLVVNTVSGTVEIKDVQVREVKASTVSGDVELELSEMPEKIDADSVSGDVKLIMPDDAGFSAEVHSVSGDVTGSLPMTLKDKTHYVSGNESCDIKIDTVSGDVQLDKRK